MVTINRDGTVQFRVFLPHATQVELLGDFTDWRQRRLALRREGPGWWTATIAVGAGDHQFSYLVDGAIWLADYAAHGVKLTGHGGWVSRLCMPKVEETPGTQIEAKADADLAAA